jgi:hypothetical protein
MYRKMFYGILLFAILASCISTSSLSDSSIEVETICSSEKRPTLKKILQSCLKDQEYLVLLDYELLTRMLFWISKSAFILLTIFQLLSF